MTRRCWLPLLLIATLAGCDAATPRAALVESPEVRVRPVAPVSIAPDGVAAAQARAQAEHKPLLLFFTAEWCSFCRQMQTTVFARPEFAKAAERYVIVEVDSARHPELCAQYRVTAYPTVILAAPDGTALDRLVGMSDVATVTTKMHVALTMFLTLRPEAATISR